MSKQTKSLETINDELNQMVLTGEGITLDDALDALEATDVSAMVAMNAEYLKIEPNSVYNVVFMGMETATLDGEVRDVVKIKNKQGEYISAAAVLVSTCKRLRHQPCLIRIITRNKIKAAKGEYIDMSVLTFPGA